jgi:3-phosphoshikimate 1-carboxyvinyltransferase
MLGALSLGKTEIKNIGLGDDCRWTISAFKKLGVRMSRKKKTLVVYGRGLSGLRPAKKAIYLGDSATSLRILLGILCGQNFSQKLTGGKSLSRRPMRRVTVPLARMGASIHGKAKANFLPLTVEGRRLCAISYHSPVASAQVKSALLFAGLYAQGVTKISEPFKSRDHTERMLAKFGAQIKVKKNTVWVKGKPILRGQKIFVPADISSAAFFIAAAVLLPGSKLIIKNVSLNPTRLGFLEVLKKMGAKIEVYFKNPRALSLNSAEEPFGDIRLRYSRLNGVKLGCKMIPRLIDELPILMVAAALAKGKSLITGIGELKIKESDRLKAMEENLQRMGAQIVAGKDSVAIQGVERLRAVNLKSYGDHRIAMSLAVAALTCAAASSIDDLSCVRKSFPEFAKKLEAIVVR